MFPLEGETMDAEEKALLSSIRENWKDDTPRLVYADWLDERNGFNETARSRLIRIGCKLYRAMHKEENGRMKRDKAKVGNWSEEEKALGQEETDLATSIYGKDFLVSTMWGWGNKGLLNKGDAYTVSNVLTISRGFIVRLKFRRECYQQVAAWAHEPIQKFTVSDADPTNVPSQGRFRWFSSQHPATDRRWLGNGGSRYLPWAIASHGSEQYKVVNEPARDNALAWSFINRRHAMAWLDKAIRTWLEAERGK